MTPELDERYAAALRARLVQEVEASASARLHPRSVRRWLGGAAAALLLGVAGSGIAYAAGAFTTTPPGGTVTTPLSTGVTVTGRGTQIVSLGPRPDGAGAATIYLTCLSAGSVYFPGGASTECSSGRGTVNSRTAFESVPIPEGSSSITIAATPGMRWRLRGNWAALTSTPWGVNAHGQSYGVISAQGTPDLVAAYATNHRQGYVYASQLQGPTPTSPQQAVAQQAAAPQERTIPVYRSDGTTQIGVFKTGG